jgi:hypothetical protein
MGGSKGAFGRRMGKVAARGSGFNGSTDLSDGEQKPPSIIGPRFPSAGHGAKLPPKGPPDATAHAKPLPDLPAPDATRPLDLRRAARWAFGARVLSGDGRSPAGLSLPLTAADAIWLAIWALHVVANVLAGGRPFRCNLCGSPMAPAAVLADVSEQQRLQAAMAKAAAKRARA